MARVTAERVQQTKREMLDAARLVLTRDGLANLSTRAVAQAAGTQMSQIQYHFGSKEGMILALFEDMNERLVYRQRDTFQNPDLTVSQKWFLACDYLEDAELLDTLHEPHHCSNRVPLEPLSALVFLRPPSSN